MLNTSLLNGNRINRRILSFVNVLFILIVVNGCATPNVDLVRQAQDNYNRAVQLDNQNRLFGTYQVQQQDIVRQVSINSMYGAVITAIDELKPEAIQQIQADGLWGNLQTIKAVSQWRLGRYAQAALTAEQALAFTQGNLARDQAINQMMPNLIRNDQAKNYVDQHQADSVIDYQQWLTQVEQPLSRVLSELPDESKRWASLGRIQIAAYLKMNEAIAYINLRDGFLNLNPCAVAPDDVKSSCQTSERQVTGPQTGNALLTEYAELLLKAHDDKCLAKQDPVLLSLQRKLGASMPTSLLNACQD